MPGVRLRIRLAFMTTQIPETTVPSPFRASLVTLATACILTASPLAQALTLVSSTLNGNGIDTALSTADLAAVDIGFVAPGAVVLTFEVDAEDVMRGSARFNSIVDNFAAEGFGFLRLALDRGTLTAGGFASNDGLAEVASSDAQSVTLAFSPAMTTQAYLGDSLLTGTVTDWTLGFDTLAAGDRFTLTMTAAIPEPAPVALTLAGLALLALRRRAR
jgi:hypothetical protein